MTIKALKYISIIPVLTIGALANAAPEEIGINSAVKGNVTITGQDETAKAAIVKDPIYLGDEVNSKHLSSLQILLKDKTVFTVGPQAQLTIDEFVYNPKSNSNKITAKVKRGMFRYMSGNAARTNPDDITINTPTASMGIRGTIFEALIGPEALLCAEKEGVIDPNVDIDYSGASLIVLRGPGGESNTNETKGEITVTSGGESVTLTQSGYATFISNKDQKPSKVFAISDPLFDYFNRRLRTMPEGDDNFSPFDVDPRVIRPEIVIEDEEGLIPFSPIDELDLPRGTPLEIETPDIIVPGIQQ